MPLAPPGTRSPARAPAGSGRACARAGERQNSSNSMGRWSRDGHREASWPLRTPVSTTRRVALLRALYSSRDARAPREPQNQLRRFAICSPDSMPGSALSYQKSAVRGTASHENWCTLQSATRRRCFWRSVALARVQIYREGSELRRRGWSRGASKVASFPLAARLWTPLRGMSEVGLLTRPPVRHIEGSHIESQCAGQSNVDLRRIGENGERLGTTPCDPEQHIAVVNTRPETKLAQFLPNRAHHLISLRIIAESWPYFAESGSTSVGLGLISPDLSRSWPEIDQIQV